MNLVGSWLFWFTKLSMFGKLEVHVLEVVWRFEPITFYISSLRVKLILPTPYQTHVELKDNSTVHNIFCYPLQVRIASIPQNHSPRQLHNVQKFRLDATIHLDEVTPLL